MFGFSHNDYSDPDVPTEIQEEKGVQFRYLVYERIAK